MESHAPKAAPKKWKGKSTRLRDGASASVPLKDPASGDSRQEKDAEPAMSSAPLPRIKQAASPRPGPPPRLLSPPAARPAPSPRPASTTNLALDLVARSRAARQEPDEPHGVASGQVSATVSMESLRRFMTEHKTLIQSGEKAIKRIEEHAETFISSIGSSHGPSKSEASRGKGEHKQSVSFGDNAKLDNKGDHYLESESYAPLVTVSSGQDCLLRELGVAKPPQLGKSGSSHSIGLSSGTLGTASAMSSAFVRTRTGGSNATMPSIDHNAFASLEKGVFHDPDMMKKKARQSLAIQPYDVTDYYFADGLCQTVARSPYFEAATLCVISFNAIWLAYDIDSNDAALLVDAKPRCIVMDKFFCLYFSLEWLFRFGAFRRKFDGIYDAWFVFDGMLCVLMVFETWVLSLVLLSSIPFLSENVGDSSVLRTFRLFKIVRLGRLARLLNSLPELVIVVKAMGVAARAVACTFLLLLFLCYIFAIVMRQLTEGTAVGARTYPTVWLSMRYLLTIGCAPDLIEPVEDSFNEGAGFGLIFWIFIVVIVITIMNMLVGILVGVMDTISAVEKEEMLVGFVRSTLIRLFDTEVRGIRKSIRASCGDGDGDHDDGDGEKRISKEEFLRLLDIPFAIQSLDRMGVDSGGLYELADTIFKDNKPILFQDFMEMVMQLRGSNQATVKDIVDLRHFIVQAISQLHVVMLEEQRQRSAKEHAKQRNVGLKSIRCTKISDAERTPDSRLP